MAITYQVHPEITTYDFIDILNRSTLGARRPVHDPEAMETMFQYGNMYVGAFDGPQLVGLARVMSDLAVDEAYQKQGIGKRLIQVVQNAIPKAKIILLAAPAAEGYYRRIGMLHHAHCYVLGPNDALAQDC